MEDRTVILIWFIICSTVAAVTMMIIIHNEASEKRLIEAGYYLSPSGWVEKEKK